MHRGLAALAVSGLLGLCAAAGCATTEFPQEGPGQPTPRAAGTLPPGSIGVCKQPFTKRPPIVTEELWEHAKPCSPRTPASYIRLGYAKAGSAGVDPEAEQLVERVLGALSEGTKADGGNNQITRALRTVRAHAAKRDELRDRIARESPAEQACDFTYLLNTMQAARTRLSPDDPCTARVFDPETRAVIAADGRAAHSNVVHVMDLLRREEVTKFAINVEPEELAAAGALAAKR